MSKKLFNEIHSNANYTDEEKNQRAERIINMLKTHLTKFGFPNGVEYIEFSDSSKISGRKLWVPI